MKEGSEEEKEDESAKLEKEESPTVSADAERAGEKRDSA